MLKCVKSNFHPFFLLRFGETKTIFMNRTILFKAKRVSNNEWIEGYYVLDGKKHRIFKHGSESLQLNGIYSGAEVHPETVCQFTGLLDKNGKKIFEGDVVFNSNKTLLTLPEDTRTYTVVWKEGKYSEDNRWLQTTPGFYFEKDLVNGVKYMSLIFSNNQIEIISNIHD